MSDHQIRTLIDQRNAARKILALTEAELSKAVGEWGRERGFLVKLTAEQALREMGERRAG